MPGSDDPEDGVLPAPDIPEMSPRDAVVDGLLVELIERQEEFGAALLVGVSRSTPKRYKPWLFEDYAVPYMRQYLPIALQCMRDGTQPDAADLQRITDSSAGQAQQGVPLLVLLTMVRAAIGAVGSYVIKQAGPRRMPAALVVLGRAAVISHDLARAATSGYTQENQRAQSEARVILNPTTARILQLAAMGNSTKEIARQLHYSEQAVTYHLGQLMKQFRVPNRTALIARAVQDRAIDLPEVDTARNERNGLRGA